MISRGFSICGKVWRYLRVVYHFLLRQTFQVSVSIEKFWKS
jgi:hypothetical protein